MGSCVSRRMTVTIDEDEYGKAIDVLIDEIRHQLETNRAPIQITIRPHH